MRRKSLCYHCRVMGFPLPIDKHRSLKLWEDVVMGDFDAEVLTIAGIDLAEIDCTLP